MIQLKSHHGMVCPARAFAQVAANDLGRADLGGDTRPHLGCGGNRAQPDDGPHDDGQTGHPTRGPLSR